ncbi:MAG: mechanosensitive ion channel domain-containing protein [Nanobdellota archaeon]
MSILEKTKNAFLLKKLYITQSNKFKTYIFFFLLLVILFFRMYYKDCLDVSALFVSVDLLLMIVAFYVVTHLLKILLLSTYRKRNKLAPEHFDNLTIGLSSIVNIIFVMSVIVGIILYSDINIKAFLTGFALFFAGLAWVFKEHVVNLVNGLMMMFSRNFTIGDYIMINSNKGIIRNISFTSTEIKSDEGNIIYIPNNIILSSEVINFSKINLKRIMFNFDFPSSNFGKLEKLEKYILNEVQKEFPELVKQVELRVGKLKSKSANMIIEITLTRYNFKLEKQVKDITKRKIIEFISKK